MTVKEPESLTSTYTCDVTEDMHCTSKEEDACDTGGTTYSPSGDADHTKKPPDPGTYTLTSGAAIPKKVMEPYEAVKAALTEKSSAEIDVLHSVLAFPCGKWNELVHACHAVEKTVEPCE